MIKQEKLRKIKINQKYFPRVWKDVIFPEIRLTGKWLQEAGFICGQFVTISLQDNAILIKVVPEIQTQPAAVKTYKKKNNFSPNRTNLSKNQKDRKIKENIIEIDVTSSQVAEI